MNNCRIHPCLLARQVDQFDKLRHPLSTWYAPLPACLARAEVSRARDESQTRPLAERRFITGYPFLQDP